jgi:hypothetical protein
VKTSPRAIFLSTALLSTMLLGCSDSEDNQPSSPASQAQPDAYSQMIAAVSRNTDDIPALAWVEAGEMYNPEALIPSQCYTRTEGKHNPCYVCHQSYDPVKKRINNLNDGFLQGTYGFSDEGRHNSWVNLFKDRSLFIESVEDQQMREYIRQDNYTAWHEWMQDNWREAQPNLQNLHLADGAFADDGLAKDGSRWVAFNFKSLPSTFWPTNGSTNDVMIRLAPEFSQINGEFSKDVYYANLSLVEMAVKELDQIAINGLNEAQINSDLDGDGVYVSSAYTMLNRAFYLGDASDIPVTPQLYPVGTEFLHTVRYLDEDQDGYIIPSTRIKEVRYSRKNRFVTPAKITSANYLERKEKHYENLPNIQDYGQRGMSNKLGWTLWGFIEDANGELRKQHFEEQFFCMGCHKSVGANIDTTFAFPRKVEGSDGWGYKDLHAIVDVPNLGERQGEYLTYLQRVGGGDEFRQNSEMLERWFHADGTVNAAEVSRLPSIYELITPSAERAMDLNKAYWQVVQEQSYLYGRDVNLTPAVNVFSDVSFHDKPLPVEFHYVWDMRLDWSSQL